MDKEKIKNLMKEIPVIFMALKHKKTPLSAKILAAVTVIYALSPIDLIPDFIPVIGYLDDLIILPFLITMTVKRIPAEVLAECRVQATVIQTRKKWLYALPVVLIWALLLWAVVQAVIHMV